MIGNNSCGTHSLLAGKTADNIHALKILLYDGTQLTVGPTGSDELDAIIAVGGRRGEIYGALRKIRNRYADLIRSKYPNIPRRVSGYNLDQLLPENGFNVARALVGTEGTCIAVLEAKAQLIPSPQHRSLVGLGYRNSFAAADHVPEIFAQADRPVGRTAPGPRIELPAYESAWESYHSVTTPGYGAICSRPGDADSAQPA